MDHGRWAASLAVIVLAACGRPADTRRPAEPPPPPQVQSEALAGPSWTLQASAASGAALVHSDAAGEEVMRLACRRRPSDLYAALPGITRIDSEDRLTLGAGDQLAVLVVSMDGPAQGLRAEGSRDPAFLAALAEGRPIAASYGARRILLPPPPAGVRTAFAAGCQDAGG
jgi:hypothetical protein